MKRELSLLAVGAIAVGAYSFQLGPSGGLPAERPGDPRVPLEQTVPTQILPLVKVDPQFARGLALFDKHFHRSEGVGTPELNADSCRACHQVPSIGGAGGLELNVSRFGDDGDGTKPFENVAGGQGLSKLRPPYVDGREEYDPTLANCFEQRQTPSLFGAGLVDTIYDDAILANEDPDDRDGDGIHGVARIVMVAGAPEVGHFGWKGQVPTLLDFLNDASAGELGLTVPDDGRGFGLLSDADASADPELAASDLDDMHHFLTLLPAPVRGGSDAPEVFAGEALFASIGCAKCHIPELNSPGGPVPLYSNLLLHDVMPDDFRGMAEPGAPVGFYRTPPLWGVSHTAPYMHDGRAEDLHGAILAHFGEALQVVQDYQALTSSQQSELRSFLEDL